MSKSVRLSAMSGDPEDPPKKAAALAVFRALAQTTPMTPLKALPAMKEVMRARLRDNMLPVGYGNPFSRLWSAVVLNKKDPERTEMETSPRFEGRKAYWNKYLGYPHDEKELPPSPYRPAVSKDPKATYFASRSTEAVLPQNLWELSLKAVDLPTSEHEATRYRSLSEVKEALRNSKYVDHKLKTGGKETIQYSAPDLGIMKMDAGEDEHGYYISYYDKWDVNPFSGVTAEFNNQELPFLKNKGDLSMGFGKPFELYGRVYYDKKTGRRISPPNPKKSK